MNISPKVWTILGTYSRAFIAAIVTQYTLGNTSVKSLFAAGAASVIPVILRWANPGDQFPAAQPSVKAAAAVVATVDTTPVPVAAPAAPAADPAAPTA
jgi:hypothetical protein